MESQTASFSAPPLALQKHVLLKQIEYYFSADNLCRDIFLRMHMSDEGYVSIYLLATFNRIKAVTMDLAVIREAICDSEVLEVTGDAVRTRRDWMQWVLPTEQGIMPTTHESFAQLDSPTNYSANVNAQARWEAPKALDTATPAQPEGPQQGAAVMGEHTMQIPSETSQVASGGSTAAAVNRGMPSQSCDSAEPLTEPSPSETDSIELSISSDGHKEGSGGSGAQPQPVPKRRPKTKKDKLRKRLETSVGLEVEDFVLPVDDSPLPAPALLIPPPSPSPKTVSRQVRRASAAAAEKERRRSSLEAMSTKAEESAPDPFAQDSSLPMPSELAQKLQARVLSKKAVWRFVRSNASQQWSLEQGLANFNAKSEPPQPLLLTAYSHMYEHLSEIREQKAEEPAVLPTQFRMMEESEEEKGEVAEASEKEEQEEKEERERERDRRREERRELRRAEIQRRNEEREASRREALAAAAKQAIEPVGATHWQAILLFGIFCLLLILNQYVAELHQYERYVARRLMQQEPTLTQTAIGMITG